MTEIISPEILLRDRKHFLVRIKGESNFARIMGFFSKYENTHLEQKQYNNPLYMHLGWKTEESFDVINSFWTVYACALIVLSRYKGYYFDGESNIPCIGTLKKNTYARKYLGDGQWKSNPAALREYANKTLNQVPELNNLAELCHCAANFMPCPALFNGAKGTNPMVRDFLPLMIDLIEARCNETHSVMYRCSCSTWKIWKEWLIDNREIYCLEDYYYIYGDEQDLTQKHIKGIPLFKGQNLEHPLPTTESEVRECINEMVTRIKNRAYRLYDQHLSNTEVSSEKCNT